VIANFHDRSAYNDLGEKRNTEVMIKAIKSGKIDIISHPFAIKEVKIDIEKISEAACLHNVLLEVNIGYLIERWIKEYQENLLGLGKMIKIAKKYNKKVIIGSDTHNIWQLGDDSPLQKIKKIIGLTEKMIINNYPKELMRQLKIKE
jgi:putative hydrolase